ncbi:PQQ-dependent sugar dehydrogenase [Nitrosopumilus sp.]|uniref:PQQ-dependent sugar dehydrogenase n=1 Tax=Nitrosopumilus sp. TaxID=2024843 RepID=UPI002931C39E|nr:PQQ-dependent sugar dehydrogenase [Nitrosopumilus sp.]
MKENLAVFVLIVVLSLVSLTAAAFAQEYPELGVKVDVVADNLRIPWSIDWAPDGTIFFTEREGNLRVIQDGKLQEKPLLSLGVGGIEGGLLGVAVDPDYSENNYIYLYYTYNELITTSNKVVRYQIADEEVIEDKVLVDRIQGGPFHDGGRIQFGPDGKLYITTGDAGNPGLSQDLNSVAGKILRINSDGTIPEDNPWENSMVYSYGHRNPQGIDWDESGNLVATEHGPSGLRGVAHDEINLVIPGTNYGWPDIIGDESEAGLQVPILHSGNDTWAPSGAEFYDGDKIPEWSGKYFVATLRGNHLHMIDFDLENNRVTSHEKLFENEFGRLRDVQTGPDGLLYILTSNQDGRGSPVINDDKILRISPMNDMINSFEDCVAAGNPVMESFPRQCNTKDGLHFVEKVEDCANVSESNPINVNAVIEDSESGVQIRVDGCVDRTTYFKVVNVTILDPNGATVRSGAIVPGSDGSFTLIVEDELNLDGEYSVKVDANNEYVSTSALTVNYYTSITDTRIETEPNSGFWQNYFEYGDIVKGKAYFVNENIEPGKVNSGTVDIQMTTPSGDKITVASDIQVTDNYAKFAIPIIEDEHDLGKYILDAIYKDGDNSHVGDSKATFYVGEEQKYQYEGQGGPLDVNMQYVEYEISPITFDLDEKSISFEFKRLNQQFTPDESWQLEGDIGLLIQRPLISPPYMIMIETQNEIHEYEPNNHEIKITEDNFYRYVLSLDNEWEEGKVTVIGTYVIPEFGSITFAVLLIGIIAMIILSTKISPRMQIWK